MFHKTHADVCRRRQILHAAYKFAAFVGPGLIGVPRAFSFVLQHDEYEKQDDSYGKKEEKKSYGYGKEVYDNAIKKSTEKKSSFYDPPNFYYGKFGLGHFGEDKKNSDKKYGQKKDAYLQSADAEIARAYDNEGYDVAGYSRDGKLALGTFPPSLAVAVMHCAFRSILS